VDDLEIWLTGTPSDLDAAGHALGRIGRIVYRSPRHTMAGADAGRDRVYARIAVTATPAGQTSRRAELDATAPSRLVDLDTHGGATCPKGRPQ
jgi:hypothetical protein